MKLGLLKLRNNGISMSYSQTMVLNKSLSSH